ncbi:alpha/beta fold hydrolase [Cecembia calidifontis]|jgi:pimeloyl-ACP methyl ester carboxylesterase|uniref:Pimeloyl-ACP methyl ester carboxylesterase n=1 Tax=Cecembia calidifontis TaxID=1187080 RepID=A0A4Q7P651_9BACT|nr:alpha/beta hydrolase [Cecembia calidifontis]RZS95461.1 pimeloyl-ACP methyl ester carboxylesterase [Cecembia calidifontis]
MKKGIISSTYGDIYYELSGIGPGPTLVLIHGVGMDHLTFQEQLVSLERHYRILVWDLPGHGNSSLKNYQKRFTELSAESLNELMEGLQISKAVLVGQSLGSMIAQYFLLKYPEKVVAVIHAPGIELKSHVGKWAKWMVPIFLFLMGLIPEKMFCKSFGKHRAEKKEVQDYLAISIGKIGKKLALKITADMCYDLIDSSPQTPKVPLLMLYGEKDLGFIKNASKAWHKKEPSSHCVEIASANHIANQDNPEDFNRALRVFLEGL